MTIYFLGAGNMASAIIGGMAEQDWQICVIDCHEEKRSTLARRYGIDAADALPELGADDVLVIAVKPQDVRQAVANIQLNGALVVSIAAGLSCDTLSAWLGGSRRLVRVMPNTPAQVGLGVAGLFADSGANDADKNTVARIMAASSEVIWLDNEAQLHAITGISGSGPAYVFYLLHALAKAAEVQGFSADEARMLSLKTFEGAVALAAKSGEDFATLQQNVTSKGGTTFEAIAVFTQNGVAAAIEEGVAACVARSEAIAAEWAKQI